MIVNAPKLAEIDANLLLYDIYEHETGIFNHAQRQDKRPLSSVALHETEENTSTSRLYMTIEAYKNKGIKDMFGLNLIEFLDLPSELCIYLMELANKEGAKNQNILSNLDNMTRAK